MSKSLIKLLLLLRIRRIINHLSRVMLTRMLAAVMPPAVGPAPGRRRRNVLTEPHPLIRRLTAVRVMMMRLLVIPAPGSSGRPRAQIAVAVVLPVLGVVVPVLVVVIVVIVAEELPLRVRNGEVAEHVLRGQRVFPEVIIL